MPPLVVAVERDPTQIEHLTAVSARVTAELRVTDSVDAALRQVETVLPDVILMPALLSSREELAIGSRLRDLGAAAAHVQLLTIPRFSPKPRTPASRMLSFRRAKAAPAVSQGPAVDMFAEQLMVYLERASAIRRSGRRPPPTAAFDPSEPRFVALIARLDELIAERRLTDAEHDHGDAHDQQHRTGYPGPCPAAERIDYGDPENHDQRECRE